MNRTIIDTRVIKIRTFLVFCTAFLIAMGCIFLVNKDQEKREKLKAAYAAETTVSKVEAQLNKYLTESELMEKLIEERTEITDTEFSELSRLMQDENQVISAHELANLSRINLGDGSVFFFYQKLTHGVDSSRHTGVFMSRFQYTHLLILIDQRFLIGSHQSAQILCLESIFADSGHCL